LNHLEGENQHRQRYAAREALRNGTLELVLQAVLEDRSGLGPERLFVGLHAPKHARYILCDVACIDL